ncbi:MAG: hypothetical protein ACRESA_09945 [Gammaproteobacteria bacterium]
MKPLFIPLRREYYEAFAAGVKRHEYRCYGARWNERTCRIGRPAVISCGYGKQARIDAWIVSFNRQPIGVVPKLVRRIYPQAETIAVIGLAMAKETETVV